MTKKTKEMLKYELKELERKKIHQRDKYLEALERWHVMYHRTKYFRKLLERDYKRLRKIEQEHEVMYQEAQDLYEKEVMKITVGMIEDV